MACKGIVLAGGAGSRLYPMTQAITKQLLPVYNKPLVYYPLSVLLLAGIRDILLISTPQDLPAFQRLLGDGARFGAALRYAEQPSPDGLAQAFLIGREFIGRDSVCLILGDNIFFGHGLERMVSEAARIEQGATVFAYAVQDPERYGVIELDAAGRPIGIEEKPARAKSGYAVTGLYFYDSDVADVAAAIRPSARGELEITDVNRHYLERGRLRCEVMGRGFAWLDAGTPDSLLESAQFVQTMERRQGLRLACLEEIAFRKGFIEADRLERFAASIGNSDYGRYLFRVLQEQGRPGSGD